MPEWLLNITNDAWYGRTSGPYQHFAIARARTIEEGLPLVRVGNNGISAIIDPYGQIIQKLELDKRGYLETALPKPIASHTLYFHYGDMIVLLMLAMALGWIALQLLRERRWPFRSPRENDHPIIFK